MSSFWEIQDKNGHVVQRLAVLTAREIEKLEQNGYRVVRRELSTRLWPWLLDLDRDGGL